jgi:glucose-6-phosphate isomerase
LYASLIDVNAYHQPGVEAGKKAAEEILSLQLRLMQALSEAGEPVSVTELASRLGAQDRAEEVFYLLRRLAANGRINLAEAPGGSGEPLASAL